MKEIDPQRIRFVKRETFPLILEPSHVAKILEQLSIKTTIDTKQISEEINIACSTYWFHKEKGKPKCKRAILGKHEALEHALTDVQKFFSESTFMEMLFLSRASYLLGNDSSDACIDETIRDNIFKKEVTHYLEITREAITLIKRWSGTKKQKPLLEIILVYHLAKIYEKATKKEFNRSQNAGGASHFISATFQAIDPEVGRGTIDAAMREVIKDRRNNL
ncbi:MAG: hypothetical protein PHD48_01920 [Alphaproteobacteria bacterium]|nr:hypothetical protein [Alphaproteobacteria bacterium]